MTNTQTSLGRHVTHADGSINLRYAGAYLALTFPQALALCRDLDAGETRDRIGEALREENVDAATGRFIK